MLVSHVQFDIQSHSQCFHFSLCNQIHSTHALESKFQLLKVYIERRGFPDKINFLIDVKYIAMVTW